jgi:sulfite exporter TauE/SafE
MNSLISKQEKYIQQIKNYIAHTIKWQGKILGNRRGWVPCSFILQIVAESKKSRQEIEVPKMNPHYPAGSKASHHI